MISKLAPLGIVSNHRNIAVEFAMPTHIDWRSAVLAVESRSGEHTLIKTFSSRWRDVREKVTFGSLRPLAIVSLDGANLASPTLHNQDFSDAIPTH